MKNEFITTENVQIFNDIAEELESDDSLVGPSLGMVRGPAGRGKTEAARRCSTNTTAIYIPPFNKTSPLMLLRRICFELTALKPGRIEGCLDMITEQMQLRRRLVIIDEADLLPMPILEMVRNVNELCGCPVLLIGEEGLKARIGSRRRLYSRIRREMMFAPVGQADIKLYFRHNVGAEPGAEALALIQRASKGDWRPVTVWAPAIERAVYASDLSEIPNDLVKEIVNGKGA